MSWSHSKTKDELRYPIQSLIQTDEPGRYTDRGAMETGSSSSGTGYTARAIIERRVTSNWFVGMGVDIRTKRLHPKPCANLCALLCCRLAGRYGLTAAAAYSLCGLVIGFSLIHL